MRIFLSLPLLLFFIGASGAIQGEEAVTIGGIRQWITINGQNEADPVLLFLHGGPGSSAMSWADEFTDQLRKHFIVVQWDQREAGRTHALNASPVPLTIALYEKDVVEMIGYLTGRFSKQKIYLMGHSWGGFLGLKIASKHAELLYAYFAVSPMIWQEESERRSLALMRAQAAQYNNREEILDLKQIDIPFSSGHQLYLDRKWLGKLMGQKTYSQSFVEGWAKKWLDLFNEASRVNFFTEAPEIRCPVYFFIGDKDYQTNFALAAEYYKMVKAPAKNLYWFEGAAHSFLTQRQKKVQDLIIQLLPKPSN